MAAGDPGQVVIVGQTPPASYAVSGDLSGTLPSPIVAKLQGQPVSATAPTNGQALIYNSSSGQWAPSGQNVATIQAPSGAYLIPSQSSCGASGGSGIGIVYLAEVDVGPAGQTFTGMVTSLTVLGSGGTSPRIIMGVYNDDGSGSRPYFGQAPLASVSFDPTQGSTGDRYVAFGANLVLPPGRYWLAWMLSSSSGAMTTAPTVVTISSRNFTIPRTDAGNNSYKGWQQNAGSTATTLPNIGTIGYSAYQPIVGLKAA